MNLLQQQLARQFPLETRRTWYARWSGGRLDLHVKSDFSGSPEAFREGVLDVGYLLQSLDHSVKLENHLLEIRSFPSLDQAQWVASIRLHRGAVPRQRDENPSPLKKEPIETIAELALAWNFSFLFLDRMGPAISEVDPSIHTSRDYLFRGILETSGNNPFVWLQIGRWLREAHDTLDAATPPLRLKWESRIPGQILQEIPALEHGAPWDDLIPEGRMSGSKPWTPQLLLTVLAAEE